MPRKKSKRSTADKVMRMWDCVLSHLAEIESIKLKALRELGSDGPFVKKLREAEMCLERMREVLACPWTVKKTKGTRRA
jgi:hypothetical protein